MKKKWNLRNPLVRKQLAALLSLTLVLTCFVGTTLAYIVAKAGPLTNVFQPVQVSCQVSQDKNQVTNQSDIPVYLRIAVTATFVSDEGKIHWENPTLTVKDDASWQQVGQYYYYKGAVASQSAVNVPEISVTGDLEGYTAQYQVLAEVIQAEPADAVHSAWKMTYNGSVWSTYSAG